VIKTAQGMEKICANHISDKGLMPKTYLKKKLLESNNETITQF
jgi:hypothetical protein